MDQIPEMGSLERFTIPYYQPQEKRKRKLKSVLKGVNLKNEALDFDLKEQSLGSVTLEVQAVNVQGTDCL